MRMWEKHINPARRSAKPDHQVALDRNLGFTSLPAPSNESVGRVAKTKVSKHISRLAAILNKSCIRTFFVANTNTKPTK